MAINNTCQKPSLVPKGPLALMPKCNDDHFCFFSHLVERTKVMSVLKAQGHLSAQGSSGLWWVVMLTFDDTNLVKKKGFVAFEMSNLKRNCIETWKVDHFFFFSNRWVNFYREVYGSSFLRFPTRYDEDRKVWPSFFWLYPISLLLPPTTTRVLELIDMHAYYSGHAGETPTVCISCNFFQFYIICLYLILYFPNHKIPSVTASVSKLRSEITAGGY